MSAVAVSHEPNLPTDRTFHDSEAPYILPNDTLEHQRLEDQSRKFWDLMGKKIFHAPTNPTAIKAALDIGCGTGIVTDKLAHMLPDATVYGIDLSPIPSVREKLPNIEYVNGNFIAMTDPSAPDQRFKAEKLDYVFSRLLVLGISDWPQYVQRCVSLVKSGGLVEMHDFDMIAYKVPDDLNISDSNILRPQTFSLAEFQSGGHRTDGFLHPQPWFPTLQKLALAKGIDIRCGQSLGQHFHDAGLEDVQITRYICPLGIWEGLTDAERRFAPMYQHFWSNIIPMLLRKLAGEVGGVDSEEIEWAVQTTLERSRNWDGNREFTYFYVVRGRKP